MAQIAYSNIYTATSTAIINSLIADYDYSTQSSDTVSSIASEADSDDSKKKALRIRYIALSKAAGVDGYSSGDSTKRGWVTQTEYTLNTSDQLNATATT